MKVLFTGGSSFTGYWFVKVLASAGHEVVTVFRRQRDEYLDDLRRKRIDELGAICHRVFGISFGDDRFLALIRESEWDLLCHHGTETADYKSPNFDVARAVASNTYRLPMVLESIAAGSCKIILTGSFFENDEGAGSRDLRAFSPYGLSKAFTWQLFRYHAELRQMTLGKFVIPNPFGPYEEPRFTHYLMKNWFAGATAVVSTPSYIRDNIHVSLLARIYADFAARLPGGISRTNPSGYVESQGAFTQRIAGEMRGRLGLPCDFDLRPQTEFSEPHVRINTDRFDAATLSWNETDAWDEFAAYYRQLIIRRPGK
jgi:UDP-glucose 4-epimerase